MLLGAAIIWSMMTAAMAAPTTPAPIPNEIEQELEIKPPGASVARAMSLQQALLWLKVPSVSIALIEDDRIAWKGAYGSASTHTIYQAASMSKLVAAVAALRLVQQGRLGLDSDINAELTAWHLPESALTRLHAVTLRGLLSMTAGVNVPGYIGYAPGSALPDLVQILDGSPPANSPPVQVMTVPGTAYAYSGGGYEIAQALVEAASGLSFAEAVQRLVLKPAGMTESFYGPPPSVWSGQVASGHFANGAPLPGRWHVMPELAAAGLWSTPVDLARLLIEISRAWNGEKNPLLGQKLAREMLTAQNGARYGLGGAVHGQGRDVLLEKAGQNVGYQGYLLLFPGAKRGIVVMTNSDNGTILATAIINRVAAVLHWPPLRTLPE